MSLSNKLPALIIFYSGDRFKASATLTQQKGSVDLLHTEYMLVYHQKFPHASCTWVKFSPIFPQKGAQTNFPISAGEHKRKYHLKLFTPLLITPTLSESVGKPKVVFKPFLCANMAVTLGMHGFDKEEPVSRGSNILL